MDQDSGFTNQKFYSEDYFDFEIASYYQPSCDLRLHAPPEPMQFNYVRFSQYLKLKAGVELLNRAADLSNGVPPPGFAHYSDGILKTELFKIYGKMEETSETFRKIFKNYKIQRLEQIEEWIRMEENGTLNAHEYVDEQSELMKYFTHEEIDMFENCSASSSNRNSTSEQFKLPKKNAMISASKTKNQRHLNQVNESIKTQVGKFLQEHPHGINIPAFIKKLNSRLKNSAPLIKEQMILDEKGSLADLFVKRKYNEHFLLFPANKTYTIESPFPILWGLKHKLLTVLNLSYGIIEVNDCVQLMNKIFHTNEFLPSDWGFKSDFDFVSSVFKQYETPNIRIVELNIKEKRNYYLTVTNTKESNKLIESKLVLTSPPPQSETFIKKSPTSFKNVVSSSSKTLLTTTTTQPSPLLAQPTVPKPPLEASSSAPTPWNKQMSFKPPLLDYNPAELKIGSEFVQIGDNIFREQNDITPGTELNCVVALAKSPTEIYLVRQTMWNLLDRLFNNLREQWLENKTGIAPHPQFLRMNYLCLAKVEKDDLEVYRVAVIGHPRPDYYKVFCIDYGDSITVHINQLRYLRKVDLNCLDAQAISCSLYNVASHKKDAAGNDIWSEEICDFTSELFVPNESNVPLVKVLFKQRVNGNGKWLVKVSTPPKIMDFGEEIMKFVNRKKKK